MPLNNSQINAILKEYDKKQFEARALLDYKKNKIYREIPRYRQLDDELISASTNFAIESIMGNTTSIKDIKKHNDNIISEKKKILKDAGYPDDYLEMKYSCEKCKDTGYIDNKHCTCFKQAAIKLLYSQALINNAIYTQNFSTFDYSVYSKDRIDPVYKISPYDNICRVVDICKEFIKGLSAPADDRNIKNLLITGQTGVGKTFLSNCIAKAALDDANSVVYISAGELFEILDDYTFNNRDNDDAVDARLENIQHCDLLIIDDLGTEFVTRFTNAKLYSCINERLLKRLPMVVSTNLGFKELQETYSERIYSRFIGEFTTLKLLGEDIRKKQNY